MFFSYVGDIVSVLIWYTEVHFPLSAGVFVFAAVEVEKSVPVLRSVCVKQAEQPQKYTSETLLMALWGGFTGCSN